MASKSQPATTTQINKTELPKWVEDASQANYELAKQVASRPFEQYQGQRVAAESPLTQQGYGMASAGSGVAPLYDEAAGLYRKSAGPLDINRFLNPYTAEVERNAIGNAERSLTSNLNTIADKQRAARAFGGSRAAIENAVTRSEGVRGIGDLSANIRRAGVDYATDTALKDRAGIQAAAGGLGNTATAKSADWLQNLQALFMGGQQQQGYGQRLLDADMAKWAESRNAPVEDLNIRLAALGMSPYGKTETMNKTSTSEKQGTDWATLGLGVLKTLPSLMMLSDRNMKTDIKKLTDGPVPLYAYRYKGDPKSYPKVVGPMAQDIEKIAPKTVKKMGKHRVVNLENLMEVLS